MVINNYSFIVIFNYLNYYYLKDMKIKLSDFVWIQKYYKFFY